MSLQKISTRLKNLEKATRLSPWPPFIITTTAVIGCLLYKIYLPVASFFIAISIGVAVWHTRSKRTLEKIKSLWGPILIGMLGGAILYLSQVDSVVSITVLAFTLFAYILHTRPD